jgi:hypothetical protein|tara:strand:- start:448 stop:699 length:252 start_codon:yes stop_codon:yes gene_type:complete
VLPCLGQARQVRYNIADEIEDGVLVKVAEHSKNTLQNDVLMFLITFQTYHVLLASLICREVRNQHKGELNELLVRGNLQNFSS